MKIISILAVLMIPAYFTGVSQRGQTPTGKPAIKCQYRLNNGDKVWATLLGYTCPSSIEVS